MHGKKIAILGVTLQFGMVVGLIGTVVGMIRAFNAVGTPDSTSEELAGRISLALYTTAGGLLVALIGLILIFVALFGTKYRAPWFYKAAIVVSIVWMLKFPVGTIVGALILVYLSKRRQEFYPLQSEGDTEQAP